MLESFATVAASVSYLVSVFPQTAVPVALDSSLSPLPLLRTSAPPDVALPRVIGRTECSRRSAERDALQFPPAIALRPVALLPRYSGGLEYASVFSSQICCFQCEKSANDGRCLFPV